MHGGGADNRRIWEFGDQKCLSTGPDRLPYVKAKQGIVYALVSDGVYRGYVDDLSAMS